jgi:large subunit ribosomal protein L4
VSSLTMLDPAGTEIARVDLPAEIFDAQVNVPLIHQVVVGQLAAKRQGTADTKTRGEVSGGGRKPYRQKGTGRARQGSIRAPQFAGGGTVHGPTPRAYDQRTPKKMKAAALRGALSDRARNGRLHVVSALLDDDTPSTRRAAATLANLTDRARVLVVVSRDDITGWKSVRNLPRIHVVAPDQVNTYDVLVADDVVFTRAGLDEFLGARGITMTVEEVPPAARPAKKTASKPRKTAAAEPESSEPEAAVETSEPESAVKTSEPETAVETSEPTAAAEDQEPAAAAVENPPDAATAENPEAEDEAGESE